MHLLVSIRTVLLPLLLLRRATTRITPDSQETSTKKKNTLLQKQCDSCKCLIRSPLHPLFSLSPLMIRFFLFLFLAVGVSALVVHPVSVPFCSGTAMYQPHSSFVWTAKNSATSTLRFSFCTAQRRALATVNSARLRVKDIDLIFNLCSSPMDCVEKSIERNSAGLFCLSGHEAMDFPLFASPSANIDVSVAVLDNRGDVLATFCKRY